MSNRQPACWIETISPDAADAELKQTYDQLKAMHGMVHNLYLAFSLQPAPLLAADRHYRGILHNEANQSEPWFLELLATQVAMIADCTYALTHHGANFKALLGDDALAEQMIEAVRDDHFDIGCPFTLKQAAALAYCAKLSRAPQNMAFEDIAALREAGLSDTEILEAVQATACFAYWVRLINALGINLGDESIGKY